MRIVLLIPLACLSACTLLNSESGLVGPPLGSTLDGGGFDATSVQPEGDGGSLPPAGDDSSAPSASGDAADGSPVVTAGDSGNGVDSSVTVDAGPGPIYSQLLSPVGIAVYGGNVCWCAGQSLRMIQCAPTSGGDASKITTVATQSNDPLVDKAFDVALDASYWYWSNGSNNQVIRKAMSGGASVQYFTGDQQVSYIVLDGPNVWASDYVAGATSGNIVVGPSGSSSQLIFPGEAQAAGVGVYSGSVYWGRSTPGSVSFAREQGNVPITRVTTAASVTGLALDSAGTTYFISGDQQIYRLQQGSTSPILLYDAGASFGDSDLALDDTWVYWSENLTGVIMRMPK